jgi:hypothetical protein
MLTTFQRLSNNFLATFVQRLLSDFGNYANDYPEQLSGDFATLNDFRAGERLWLATFPATLSDTLRLKAA